MEDNLPMNKFSKTIFRESDADFTLPTEQRNRGHRLQPGRWSVITKFSSFCSPSNYHCTMTFFVFFKNKQNKF